MILHPAARRELDEAALYYESRLQGLGFRFASAIESGFHQIEQNPFLWRRIRGEIRRFLVKTFPLGLVYVHDGGEIHVLAVMHLKREPDYWLGRLAALPPPPEKE